MTTTLTQGRLRELLSYDAESGEFRHLSVRPGVRRGALAGGVNPTDGYRYIGVDGRKYASHRLAWLYVNSEWPDAEVGFLDGSLVSPLRERFDNLAMTVVGDLTAIEVRQIFSYDPETGIIIYRTPRRGVTVGKRAGSVDPDGYRYIGVRGKFFSAQQLAWVHAYGEWADSAIRFRNGDKDDCRIENLHRPIGVQGVPELRRAHDKADRKVRPDLYRDRDLWKTFGIRLTDYQQMFLEQNGCCAICMQPETAERDGTLKWLAVDHDHKLGKGRHSVRGLLCNGCNPMIGYAKDDPARLRAAADYLDAHAAQTNVVPLKKEA